MTLKIMALSLGALTLLTAPAWAQGPDAPPPSTQPAATPTSATSDTPPPAAKTDPEPEKVAKADQPVCRYVPIDNSMIRKRVCR
jgi:hypothetical protein